MAALQITYGDPAASYDITRLDIIDPIPSAPLFLQNANNLLQNNITRLDIIDPIPSKPIFLQDANKLLQNNITRLVIIDPTPAVETAVATSKESWE